MTASVTSEQAQARFRHTIGLRLVADISIVAIAIALSAYGIDRIDLLGGLAEKRQIRIIERLDANINDSLQRLDSLLLELQALG